MVACLPAGVAQAQQGAFQPLPPFVAAYEPQGVDERGIWMRADEDERELRDSPLVIKDQKLNAYIRGVLCKTVGDERCGAARIYVVRVAAFNASMSPNGTLQIWSGLLLRVRDEAELASVLGHEFAHFELRHSLRDFQQRRKASDIIAWAGFLGTGGALIQFSALGSFYSFGRAQEEAADLLSMRYLAASPYNPNCFADIWQRMMDESDATALGRKQRSTRYDRVAFFANHPTDLQRTSYLRKIAGPPRGDEGEAQYREGLGHWRGEFLGDQLKLNDFGGTDYLLGALASSGWTAELLVARGDLYRMRANPRDLVSASDFYRAAIVIEPDNADAYRGLGLALMRGQSLDEGREALRHYLVLRPDAADAAMISTLLQ